MSNLSIIIMGAGKGTRMKSSISKILHKVGNLEMINHVINSAKQLNPEEICIVCSEENIDAIKQNISQDIITTIQKDRLGTAHATQIGYSALKHKNNKILIMYGDVPLITVETYQKIINLLNNSTASIINLAFRTKNLENKYGRLIINNSEVEKIVEFKDATIEIKNIDLCNSGILAIKNDILENLLSQVKNENASKEYYLTDIIEIARKENKICKYVIGTEEEVMGVNSRYDLSIAEKIFQDNKRKEFMLNGVTLIDPQSVYFSYDTKIENDVIIEPNVIIFPKVKIKSNAIIHSFSYLESCEINENVVVGPFARIRPNTILKNGSRIGNFVEIKKTIVGENTKINHLTYIGDSTIGNNTNIGAGSITCNYNGYTKSQTEIGNNCFIGSNTIMIAPITLKDGCITGAGSVITKSVNENDIAIARSKQENLNGKAIAYRNKYKNK